jgi:phosphopantetheine--protein transferase-like protein|tara:strand:- start:8574 stop:8909 length:336 start_codon:yes stop_codon:yes gene_type:complete
MIGIDIITIERFKKIKKSDFKNWQKFFTVNEWKYAFRKADPSQTLAGMYAAKEAVMKAVGGDLLERVDRIEVSNLNNGKPVIKIDKKEQSNIHISISHTKDTAAAISYYEQ